MFVLKWQKNVKLLQNMKDLSYDDLCKLMTEHHEQAPPMHLQRTKFEAWSRLPNETIPEFVSALRDLSKHCLFGASLEERLCERIVRGLNNQRVQRTLLRESSLELKKAISIAQAAEITDFGSKELCESKEGRNVNYVNKSKVNTTSKVGGKFNNIRADNRVDLSIKHCVIAVVITTPASNAGSSTPYVVHVIKQDTYVKYVRRHRSHSLPSRIQVPKETRNHKEILTNF